MSCSVFLSLSALASLAVGLTVWSALDGGLLAAGGPAIYTAALGGVLVHVDRLIAQEVRS